MTDGTPRPAQSTVLTHEPVAYRWRQPGSKLWIYDPTPKWLEEHRHEIEVEPLYAALAPGNGTVEAEWPESDLIVAMRKRAEQFDSSRAKELMNAGADEIERLRAALAPGNGAVEGRTVTDWEDVERLNNYNVPRCTCPCSCDETPHGGKPCEIHDSVSSTDRDATIERQYQMINRREEFIASKGLWKEFSAYLSRSYAEDACASKADTQTDRGQS